MRKKVSDFIQKYDIAIIIWSVIVCFVNFKFIMINYYNVFAIISVLMGLITAIRVAGWKFGHLSIFMKDYLWVSLKQKSKESEYPQICLNTATQTFVIETISCVCSVAFFLIVKYF